MIFEVPIDHFPINQTTMSRRPPPLKLSNVSNFAKQQTSVPPMSPSVTRSQFNFHSQTSEKMSIRAAIPPLKRAFTSPALPVQHLNLSNIRKSSTPSTNSRNNSVSDLMKSELFRLPSRLLSNAVSLHQLS